MGRGGWKWMGTVLCWIAANAYLSADFDFGGTSLGAGRMRGNGWAEGVEVDGDGFVLDRCERIFIR